MVCHLTTYIATQLEGQTNRPHFTTITGGATTSTRGSATPEMPPIFKQKSTVKFSGYSNVWCPQDACSLKFHGKYTVICMVSVLALPVILPCMISR